MTGHGAGAYGPDETPDWLSRRAQRSPGALALRAKGRDLTYADLDVLAGRAAGTLAAQGVAPGDRVAALLPSGIDFAVLLHAVLRLGATLVPVNTRLAAQEMAFVLQDSAPRVLVLGDRLRAQGEPLAQKAGIPVLRAGEPLLAGATAPERGHCLSDLAALVYTSGTTGRPKGAMLTWGNFYHGAVTSALGVGTVPEDRWLLCMPLFHVGGLSILLRATLYGIAVVAQDGFSEQAVARAFADDGVTIASLVPVMLRRLLDAGVVFPSALRYILLGGGPTPRDLLERATTQGVPIAPTYGLTETASQAVTMPPAEVAGHIGAAGRPLFLTEVRIGDGEHGLAPGEPGEILVRGPTVSPGYWQRPAATAAALAKGWLHTGDVGYLDQEGYLYVLDRRDDLIVSGGENVYPAEVEDALSRHPAVLDAGVYGLEDPVWGQAVHAAVVLREGAQVTQAQLLDFLRTRLAGYKVPQTVSFWDGLPRNAGGKLMRRLLRKKEEDA
ncbi:MAG: o-succinylbenzoate--CoA ligase [Thermaerobacter sp.]|nr:o-succinylbenzoate--CoA ligase [Thermaerobacter sp.]